MDLSTTALPTPARWRAGLSRPRSVDPELADRGYWVLPGRLMAGRFPANLRQPSVSSGDLPRPDRLSRRGTELRVAALRAAGITQIAAFIEPAEFLRMGWRSATEAQLHLKRSGIRLTIYPTPDWCPVPPETMQRAQADIDRALAAGEGVLICCKEGIGRTATATGRFLVRSGYSRYFLL